MLNKCTCYAVMSSSDPAREALWKRVFPPDGRLPIRSPVAAGMGNFPGGQSPFYLMDMSRVTPEQKQLIIEELARKFHIPEKAVASDIERDGIPVKADDVIVAWCPRHMRAAL
jgi:hypothetical protein